MIIIWAVCIKHCSHQKSNPSSIIKLSNNLEKALSSGHTPYSTKLEYIYIYSQPVATVEGSRERYSGVISALNRSSTLSTSVGICSSNFSDQARPMKWAFWYCCRMKHHLLKPGVSTSWHNFSPIYIIGWKQKAKYGEYESFSILGLSLMIRPWMSHHLGWV